MTWLIQCSRSYSLQIQKESWVGKSRNGERQRIHSPNQVRWTCSLCIFTLITFLLAPRSDWFGLFLNSPSKLYIFGYIYVIISAVKYARFFSRLGVFTIFCEVTGIPEVLYIVWRHLIFNNHLLARWRRLQWCNKDCLGGGGGKGWSRKGRLSQN